ncbi:glycosyltransferase family 4 protein [Taibaiella lutea]|uniref:Glycosyltransferase family 4 protein n=1 Tax=Taibaiella lutea TaxID=2608001 RepID=A0A5M6CKV3_9BACT|nr:glycosyltransferase [Taibaiella lutea]KAA5533769.1 glycosyltransferase family 4 protein [Taibaiella lutea]
MNVLFLPENIASMPAITMEAMNKIEGVHAKALTKNINKYQSVSENVIHIQPPSISRRKPIKWLVHKYKYRKLIRKWIDWADVLQYTWGPVFDNGSDLKYAHKKGKLIFVEWVGSDIRKPKFLSTINKFFNHAWQNGYEYKEYESEERSIKMQTLFAHYNAIPVAFPEMSLYLEKKIFKKTIPLFYRINVFDFVPDYPSVEKQRPLIIHSPTALVAKGSNIIFEVIKELQAKYSFDFKLLNDLPRNEVLEIMAGADIFIDQIIVGSYGTAAMEAMSLGKPVMCYIMPETFEAGMPKECPIVNSSPDNLKEQLIKLITDSKLRYEIGIKSRQFAEKYHNVDKVALEMIEIYKNTFTSKGN